MDIEKEFDSFDGGLDLGGDLNLEEGLNSLDEASLEGFGEVDTNIDKPHFQNIA